MSIINREANPEYKIPWLVITLLIPLFGAALYLIFYSRKLSKKEARLLGRINQSARAAEGEGYSEKERIHLSNLMEEGTDAFGKVRALLDGDPLATLYRASQSRYYPLGENMYLDMLRDIEGAQKYIFLEYFIVEEGKMWDEIYSRLKEKAREGVDVRVLYDDIGCMKTLPSSFPKKLSSVGIKCHRFSKVTPRVSAIHNNRDHRKILVIDGKTAYTGGVNIADEYINAVTKYGHWKDGGVRVTGDAALGFVKLFLSSWDFTVGGVSDYSEYFPLEDSDDIGDGGYYVPFGTGPLPIYRRSVGKDAFINLINQAKRYVYITTPNLIIDYSLTEALKSA
ncbi:MAG: PLDc N-terminal domain-containing protein, partial [Clostridia bacterium]|nr:PLDc N-terminal domain-containing protein [Clostridia bacterium]